jgi:thiamine monophosphate synthase
MQRSPYILILIFKKHSPQRCLERIPVYFLGGMRIKDLEKTRKLGAQGIAGASAF